MERVLHNNSTSDRSNTGIRLPHSTDHSARQESLSPVPAPIALDPRRVQQLQQTFAADLAPQTAVEQVLVQHAALAAAYVEFAESCEFELTTAVTSAEQSPMISGLPPEIAAGWSSQLDLICKLKALSQVRRYGDSHWRRLSTALQEFRKLSRRNSLEARRADGPQRPSEEECLERLRRRFEQSDWSCPGCGEHSGFWLARQRAWECRACQRQVGLRVNTAMERSPLALSVWAFAFMLLRENPQLSTVRLAELLSIRRTDTVRRLKSKLLPMLETPEKLGGLVPC